MSPAPAQPPAPGKARGRTGPRSAAGKARASQNARRHGLATPVLTDPALSHEVDELARHISNGDHRLFALAVRVAEAQIDLRRIRRARSDALQHALNNPEYRSNADLRTFNRIATKAFCAILEDREPKFPNEDMVWEVVERRKEVHPVKQVRTFLALAIDLSRLAEYERRAFSRRKRAIRALDEALQQT